MRLLSVLAALASLLSLPAAAGASPYIRYGVQDDAWLQYGPGTLDERLTQLDELGVDVVRVTDNWRSTEWSRGVYAWSRADRLPERLHEHGSEPLVTLWGTPAWANGGHSQNWAPTT